METIDLDPGKNTYEITGKGEKKELCQESKTPGHYYNCLCHKRAQVIKEREDNRRELEVIYKKIRGHESESFEDFIGRIFYEIKKNEDPPVTIKRFQQKLNQAFKKSANKHNLKVGDITEKFLNLALGTEFLGRINAELVQIKDKTESRINKKLSKIPGSQKGSSEGSSGRNNASS